MYTPEPRSLPRILSICLSSMIRTLESTRHPYTRSAIPSYVMGSPGTRSENNLHSVWVNSIALFLISRDRLFSDQRISLELKSGGAIVSKATLIEIHPPGHMPFGSRDDRLRFIRLKFRRSNFSVPGQVC